ncbi:MAG: hypothetical protein ACTSXC_06505 [Candidatus Freyarchaeota archaeon]
MTSKGSGVDCLKEKIREAFMEAFPHLCEPLQVKELLERELENVSTMDELISRLDRRVLEERSPTEKTDIKIILMFLERKLRET